MVPRTGLEPVHSLEREILSLLCLPISPPGQMGCFKEGSIVLISSGIVNGKHRLM